MTKPKLLLLDEPSAGLAPQIVTEIYSLIQRIAESGATILLVDQNIMKALEVSDFMYLLEMGQVKQGGPQGNVKVQGMGIFFLLCPITWVCTGSFQNGLLHHKP